MRFFADPYDLIRAGLLHFKLPFRSETVIRYYMPCSTALLGVAVVYCLLAQAPEWRRIAVISCAALLYPHITQDYKLVLLVLPLCAWLLPECHSLRGGETAVGENSRLGFCDKAFLLGLGVLFIPKHYVHTAWGLSLSCVISPVVLLALQFTLLCDYRGWREGGRRWRETWNWYLAPFRRAGNEAEVPAPARTPFDVRRPE